MKLVTEYLERAVQLEALARDEKDEHFKASLLSQADAYRKLAAKRAEESGLAPPVSQSGMVEGRVETGGWKQRIAPYQAKTTK